MFIHHFLCILSILSTFLFSFLCLLLLCFRLVFYSWGQFSTIFAMVFGGEVLVDWIKHGFIIKFNQLTPSIYDEYSTILARCQLTTCSSGSAHGRCIFLWGAGVTWLSYRPRFVMTVYPSGRLSAAPLSG